MSEEGFSGMVDHFGLASASLKLHSSSSAVRGKGTEHALDACGNTVEQGNYIEGAGTAVECVYHLQDSSLNLNTLTLGVHAIDDVIESIAVSTSNGAWPEITVTGFINATGTPGGNPQGENFTLPDITIDAKRCAQEMGFTFTGDVDLQSTTLSASGETHFDLADADTVGVVAFTGAELTIGGEATVREGSMAITYTATNVVATKPPQYAGEITGWASASFEGTGFIEPDA
jgi:hypothetical protein